MISIFLIACTALVDPAHPQCAPLVPYDWSVAYGKDAYIQCITTANTLNALGKGHFYTCQGGEDVLSGKP
jgi:hypothetical protein